jgi:hypothetical protein
MPVLTVEMTITHGDDTVETAVPCREPFSYSITYTEETTKRTRVPAGATDTAVLLDTVGSPKFVFVQSLETDVDVKLSDGVATDIAAIAVAEGAGWIMLANPTGQAINRLLVTTPASPVEGALIRILSFE